MLMNDNVLTYNDAAKFMAPKAFNLLVKPIGSSCNLRCKYCYYLDKASLYEYKESKMNDDLLELFVKQYIECNEVDEVTFNWHGGEPLLAGLDFYKKAIGLQKKYASGKRIGNTIQTNGMLITPEWAQFFKDNDFLVGISIDGPKEMHDGFRRANGGGESWTKVMHGMECLYRNNVEYNTLSTINHLSENQGLNVYQFLKQCGTNYMQFLPVCEQVNMKTQHIVSPDELDAVRTEWSVSPQGFGKFMCDIFDYWVKHDVGRVYVQLFDVTLAKYAGLSGGLCAFEETCGGNAVVEHNGDVYLCDHFVYQSHKIGNIRDASLKQILSDGRVMDFGLSKRNGLSQDCLSCKYSFVCHGECPKHRFGGGLSKNALCDGYKMFFEHSEPYMLFMLNELKKGDAPANVMDFSL